jgi:hypothetical protein
MKRLSFNQRGYKMPTPEVNIPTDYNIRIKEAPTTYTLIHDAGLEDIRIKEMETNSSISIEKIPRIEMESNNSISIEKIPRIDLNSALRSDNNIRITEIPDIRAHVPMNFNFGVKLFGLEFLVFCLCGEMQVITEKYVPNKWERCEVQEGCHDNC